MDWHFDGERIDQVHQSILLLMGIAERKTLLAVIRIQVYLHNRRTIVKHELAVSRLRLRHVELIDIVGEFKLLC